MTIRNGWMLHNVTVRYKLQRDPSSLANAWRTIW